MNDETSILAEPRSRSQRLARTVPRLILLALITTFVLSAFALAAITSDWGKARLVERINATVADNGLSVGIARVEGSLLGSFTLREVTLHDRDGVWADAPTVQVNWSPRALMRLELIIRSIEIARVNVARRPDLLSAQAKPFALPDIDFSVGTVRISDIYIAPAVADLPAEVPAFRLRLDGSLLLLDKSADVSGQVQGLADVTAAGSASLQGPSDLAIFRLVARPEEDQLELEMRVAAPPDGALAALARVREGFTTTLIGDGSWARWDGALRAAIGSQPLADFDLGARSGRITATGTLFSHPALPTAANWLLTEKSAVTLSAQAEGADLTAELISTTPATVLRGDLAYNRDKSVLDGTQLTLTGQKLSLPADISGLSRPLDLQDPKLTASISGPISDPAIDWTFGSRTARLGDLAAGTLAARGRTVLGPERIISSQTVSAGRFVGLPETLEVLREGGKAQADLLFERARNRLVVPRLSVDTATLDVTAEGLVDLPDGAYQFELRSAFARRELVAGKLASGAVLQARLSAPRRNVAPTVSGMVESRNMRVDDVAVAGVIGPNPAFRSRFELGANQQLNLRDILLTGQGARFSGNLQIAANRQLSGQLDGQVPSLSSFNIATAGLVRARAELSGTRDDPRASVTLDIPELQVGGYSITNVEATARPANAGRYAIQADGQTTIGTAVLTASVGFQDGPVFDRFRAELGDWTLSGALAPAPLGLWSGVADLAAKGLSAKVRFAPREGVAGMAGPIQVARIEASGSQFRPLAGQRISAGRVSVQGELFLPRRDERQRPWFNGTGQLDNVIAADLRTGRLRFRADGSAKQQRLNAQFSGNRGGPLKLDVEAQLTPTTLALVLSGDASGQAIALAAPAVLRQQGKAWVLDKTALKVGDGSLTLDGRWQPDELAFTLLARNLQLDLLELWRPGISLTGQVSGSVSATLPADSAPKARTDLSLVNVRRSGLTAASTPVSMSIRSALTERKAELQLLARVAGQQVGRAQVDIPIIDYTRTSRHRDGLLASDMTGQLVWAGPAEALWALTGLEGHDVSGPIEIDATLAGTPSEPRLFGDITSTGGRYENLRLGTVVDQISLAARFDGPRLEIVSAEGKAGKDSKVTATGFTELSRARGWPTDIDFSFENARVIRRDDLQVRGTGTLKLAYGPGGGLLKGAARVTSGRYVLGLGAREPIPEMAVEEKNIELVSYGLDARRPPRLWTLDIDLTGREQFSLEGRGLTSEWRGAVNIGGNHRAISMQGRMDLLRGTYEFAGRRFELDRGTIQFAGGEQINPQIDIVASNQVDNLTAFINIGGTAALPIVRFSSVPLKPQDEVLSQLLFGTTIDNLNPADAVQLASALAALEGGENSGLDVIGRVQRATGVDRLRVLPADESRGRGTVFAGGKYLTNRVYVEVQTDGSGYTASLIEVDLTRTLSILSEIATLGGTNASVRWSRDY